MSTPGYYGPDEEDLIDRVNAQPLPAGASNGAMPSEWPPQVPAEAPGMVPVAPLIAGPKAPILGAPPPAVAPAPPINVPAQTAQAFADQGQLSDAGAVAAQQLGAARTAAGTKEADALEAEAQRKQDAAEDAAAVTAEANKRTQAWADRAQAETEKYQKMDLHDYWADKSTGNKVLAGLAMLTGAIGRTDNSGNAGMNIINGAIERDFRLQQARIEKQKGNAAAAREQYGLAAEQGKQTRDDIKLKEAAAVDASAAKLVALKVRQGIPVDQAQNDADAIALKQKANQLRLGTLKDVHQQNIEDAKLQIDKQKEADERLRAEAYAKKMGRTGAGGAANNAAEAKILKAIEEGKTGSDVRALAAQLGVKPQRVDALENQGRAAAAAEKKNVTGEDNPLAVRDGEGNVRGLAPNARAVKAIEDRIVQYDQSIKSLEELKASRTAASLPSIGAGDPKYDKAVLAIASTTQANASDKTTTHEADTLKKYGFVNQEAIDSALADQKERQAKFMRQLRPLPAPKAGSDAAPEAAAMAPAPARKGIVPGGGRPAKFGGKTGILYPDGRFVTD